MMEKEASDLAGNNCIRDIKGKILLAEDGRKSVERAHGGHHE